MTAIRGALARGGAAAAANNTVSLDRLPIAAGLCCVLLAALAVRLVPTVISPSINWGDEIFQTVEPAHRLVFGYGLVTWEYQVGLRSWLLPGALAGLIEFGRLFGGGPQAYLAAIAVALGLLATAPIVCVFLWGRRQFGLAGGFVAAVAVAAAPELVYFGARALNEVVAAHLLVIAIYLIRPGYPAADWRRQIVAGLLFGLVCLLRLQLAPAVAVVALWPGEGGWRQRLPALVAGGAAALLCGGLLDWPTLGYPFASIWRNLYYNLYLGISSGFSVEPRSYYLLGELAVWGAAAPLVLLLVGLGARRMPVLLAAVLVVVAVHSAIPHKEYRFIYPAVLLAMMLAALGLAELTGLAAASLHGRGLRQALAAAGAAIVLAGGWAALSFAVWSTGTLAALRQRAHNELLAMSYVRDLPGLCGVGMLGKNAWVRYGGYTYLHRPVPMFWPQDDGELARSAAGFDTLLYDSSERRPAPLLGFRDDRCFGNICVARRPGRCAEGPAPAMWFPPALRNDRPDERKFAPLPEAK